MATKKSKSKKKKTYSKHILYHTRIGFYSLTIIAVLGILTVINIAENTLESSSQVLGEHNESAEARGQEARRTEKEEKEHEAKKEEFERKYEIESEGMRIRFEAKEKGLEGKIESDHEFILEDKKLEELTHEIKREFEREFEAEIASEGGSVVLKKENVKAKSDFPLTIDVTTNQLSVTRPDGTIKVVAILPDQAVHSFLSHKKVELINTDPDTGSSSASIEEAETEVKLVERNNELVYEIKGKEKHKIFGIVPVSVPTTGYVSAETGEIVDEEKSFFTEFIDFLSF